VVVTSDLSQDSWCPVLLSEHLLQAANLTPHLSLWKGNVTLGVKETR
jgi:hypothetical protein